MIQRREKKSAGIPYLFLEQKLLDEICALNIHNCLSVPSLSKTFVRNEKTFEANCVGFLDNSTPGTI